jgi:hypothetical protein
VTRITVRIRRSHNNVTDCAASDSGAVTMSYERPHNSHAQLITLGYGRPHRVQLPYIKGGYGPLMSLSPNGRDAVLVARDVGDPVIVGLLDGHLRKIAVPAMFRSHGSYGLSGEQGFGPNVLGVFGVAFHPLPQWVAPNLIVASPGKARGAGHMYPLMLNPTTGQWNSVQKLKVSLFCPLASGRVLFASPRRKAYTLYLSNSTRTHLAPVDTSKLGTIHAVSCPMNANSVYVSLGESRATLYRAAGSTIDGSQWSR